MKKSGCGWILGVIIISVAMAAIAFFVVYVADAPSLDLMVDMVKRLTSGAPAQTQDPQDAAQASPLNFDCLWA